MRTSVTVINEVITDHTLAYETATTSCNGWHFSSSTRQSALRYARSRSWAKLWHGWNVSRTVRRRNDSDSHCSSSVGVIPTLTKTPTHETLTVYHAEANFTTIITHDVSTSRSWTPLWLDALKHYRSPSTLVDSTSTCIRRPSWSSNPVVFVTCCHRAVQLEIYLTKQTHTSRNELITDWSAWLAPKPLIVFSASFKNMWFVLALLCINHRRCGYHLQNVFPILLGRRKRMYDEDHFTLSYLPHASTTQRTIPMQSSDRKKE